MDSGNYLSLRDLSLILLNHLSFQSVRTKLARIGFQNGSNLHFNAFIFWKDRWHYGMAVGIISNCVHD